MALTDNLISYWKLDEASGTRNDSHGTNHLTDNNTVGSATGKINSAADFEKDNDEWLDHIDNSDLSTGDIDFTFSGWVYAESLGGSTRIVLGKTNLSTAYPSGIEYMLEGYTDNKLYFTVSSGSSAGQTNGTTISTATWYFFVAWHDSVANTVNLQVNDGSVDSVSYAGGGSDTAFDFRIGYGFSSGLYWDGLIDEVGFWKRVLTSDERTSLYNSGAGLAYGSFGGGGVTVAPPPFTNRTWRRWPRRR